MKNFNVKTILNVKTIIMIIFLSLTITSCTDIISEDDYPQETSTEITTNQDVNGLTGGNGEGGDGTGKGD